MTKKAHRRLIASHLQWSIIGLIIALFVAFITSDHRSVVYGVPAAESEVSGELESLAPVTFSGPATAPQKSPVVVVPDTVNGELVWPDPWDDIVGDFPVSY